MEALGTLPSEYVNKNNWCIEIHILIMEMIHTYLYINRMNTVRGEILEGQNIGKCMLTNLLAVINWQIPSEYCLYKYCISGTYIINSYGVKM